MELRLANLNEAKLSYQCIEDARAYHKSLGFEQFMFKFDLKKVFASYYIVYVGIVGSVNYSV